MPKLGYKYDSTVAITTSVPVSCWAHDLSSNQPSPWTKAKYLGLFKQNFCNICNVIPKQREKNHFKWKMNCKLKKIRIYFFLFEIQAHNSGFFFFKGGISENGAGIYGHVIHSIICNFILLIWGKLSFNYTLFFFIFITKIIQKLPLPMHSAPLKSFGH